MANNVSYIGKFQDLFKVALDDIFLNYYQITLLNIGNEN